MEFQPYPKTPRLKRDIVITEKLDGTNAQVVIKKITEVPGLLGRIIDGEPYNGPDPVGFWLAEGVAMFAGSRTRWITPGKTTDNYGFAGWCHENANDLLKLGEGQHFGEWYGQGIQRGYGLDHKRFALFNTARWGAHNPNTPKCCEVVPVLHQGSMQEIEGVLCDLEFDGSRAVPGFMKPEGIIVYHTASQQNFKVLLENDHAPKGTH
jgi:hypothetical protein